MLRNIYSCDLLRECGATLRTALRWHQAMLVPSFWRLSWQRTSALQRWGSG